MTRIPRSGKKRPSPKLRYRKACTFIDRHLRREGAHAVGIQRTGKHMLWIERHEAYRYEGFDSFEAWVEKRLKFRGEWAEQYKPIGSSFTVAELRGKQHGVQALAAIAKTASPFREALLRHGQRHEASVIRSAYRRACACRTEEQGLALLESLLAPREGADGESQDAEEPSLTRLASRMRRRLHGLHKEVRRVRRRAEAGDLLPTELRDTLRRELRLTANELTGLEGALRVFTATDEAGATLH